MKTFIFLILLLTACASSPQYPQPPSKVCEPSCEEGFECYYRGCTQICNTTNDCAEGKYCSYLEVGKEDTVSYVHFCADVEEISTQKLYDCSKVDRNIPCIKEIEVQKEYTKCETNNDCTSYVHEGVCHVPPAIGAPVSKEKLEEYKSFIRELNDFENFDPHNCPLYSPPAWIAEYESICYNNECKMVMVNYEDFRGEQ